MDSHELVAWLIEASLASSAAIVLVLMLRKPMRKAFGAQLAYASWWLVPVSWLALLLPTRVEILSSPDRVAVMGQPVTTLVAVESTQDWTLLWLAAWAIGSLATAVWLWSRQRRFERALGKLEVVDAGANVLRAQSCAGLPALVGLLRPRIVLPADHASRYDSEQQVLLLAHESSHKQGGDAWVNALVAMVRTLLWCNPLVHLAESRLRHDQELACDARVLAAYPQSRRRYADAIFDAALAMQAAPMACHWGKTHPLKERIMLLNHERPVLRRRVAGMVLLAGVAGTTGFGVWAAQPPRILMAESQGGQQQARSAHEQAQRDQAQARQAQAQAQQDQAQAQQNQAQAQQARVQALVAMAMQPQAGLSRPINGQQSAQEDAQSRQTAPPNYPTDALAEGRAVTAMLQVDIDAQGGVLAARVERSSGDPRLDASVLAAAKRWRFYPNIRNGKAVPGRLRIPVQFTKDVPPAIPPPPSPPPLPASAVPPPPPAAPAASARQSGMNLRAGTVGASAAVRPDALMPEVLPGGMPPVYPAELSRRGVGGTVHLLVDVAANGSVRQAKIEFSSGNRELDAAALEAVGSWRFRPALKDGKAVAGQVRVPVMFQPPAEVKD